MRPNPLPLVRLVLFIPVLAGAMVLMIVAVPLVFVTAIPVMLVGEVVWLASVFVGLIDGRAGQAVSELGGEIIEAGGAVLDGVFGGVLGWYFDYVVDAIL